MGLMTHPLYGGVSERLKELVLKTSDGRKSTVGSNPTPSAISLIRKDDYMKARSQAYNRDVSKRKALRKRRLSEAIYFNGKEHPYYDNLHQYSKNKIHCSCPYCNSKTRNKGSRRHSSPTGNYQRAIHYKASDLRRVVEMDEDLREHGYHVPKHQRDRYS